MKMTETIKDVMETLIEYANGGVSGLYPPEDDIQELVDYILDLQEEIERLNKDNGDIIKLFAKEREETKRLKNIINETKKGLDKFYKEHSRLMWTEEDYIEFINCIDRELKGSDKE